MSGIQMLMVPDIPFVGPVYGFTPWAVIDTAFAPQSSLASITLENDGSITGSGNNIVRGALRWFLGAVSGNYWARWTTINSTFNPSAGPINVWLPLSSSRTWTSTIFSSGGSRQSEGRIEIASDSAGSTIVAASDGWYLEANSEI
jgi:hypothetical protein